MMINGKSCLASLKNTNLKTSWECKRPTIFRNKLRPICQPAKTQSTIPKNREWARYRIWTWRNLLKSEEGITDQWTWPTCDREVSSTVKRLISKRPGTGRCTPKTSMIRKSMQWRAAKSLMTKLTKSRKRSSNFKRKRKDWASTSHLSTTQIQNLLRTSVWTISGQIIPKEKCLISATTWPERLFKLQSFPPGPTAEPSLKELRTMILSERENNSLKSQNQKRTLSVDLTAKLKLNCKRVTHPQSEPVNSSAKALPGSAIPEKTKTATPLNPEKSLNKR